MKGEGRRGTERREGGREESEGERERGREGSRGGAFKFIKTVSS